MLVLKVLSTKQDYYLERHLLSIEYQIDERAFKNEIQALNQIRRWNIVRPYGFCSTNEFNFLVYEYTERGSLGAILKSELMKPLSLIGTRE